MYLSIYLPNSTVTPNDCLPPDLGRVRGLSCDHFNLSHPSIWQVCPGKETTHNIAHEDM